MKYETLLYERKCAIGILTLNRPERLNAINAKMFKELEAFWLDRMHDLDTRVIILTGAGDRGFCAGADIKDMPDMFDNKLGPMNDYQIQVDGAMILLLMRQVPQPIICSVHKAAAGGGFAFALASDIRIITPEAKFCASAINIGLGSADLGSSYFLPRLIGAGRAYEFLLTGDFIYAEDALKLGLVSRVVPYEELMPAAMEFANKMVAKSPAGLRLTKEALNQNLDAAGLEQAMQLENRNQALIAHMNRLESGRATVPYYKKDG